MQRRAVRWVSAEMRSGRARTGRAARVPEKRVKTLGAVAPSWAIFFGETGVERRGTRYSSTVVESEEMGLGGGASSDEVDKELLSDPKP